MIDQLADNVYSLELLSLYYGRFENTLYEVYDFDIEVTRRKEESLKIILSKIK